MIDAGVEAFFEKYADATLSELLEDLGVTREIMRTEAMRFAPHAIDALHRARLLEPLVRMPLARFYRSGVVEEILAKRLAEA